MDNLNFPPDWAEEYKGPLQVEAAPDPAIGPDLLHKHKIGIPGILTQTVELTTTAQQGEQ